MSLQLILGGSGAGKSTYLYSSIIEESINNPDTDNITYNASSKYTATMLLSAIDSALAKARN